MVTLAGLIINFLVFLGHCVVLCFFALPLCWCAVLPRLTAAACCILLCLTALLYSTVLCLAIPLGCCCVPHRCCSVSRHCCDVPRRCCDVPCHSTAVLCCSTPMFCAFPQRCWSVPCYSAPLSLPSALPFPLLQVLPLLLLAAWSLPLAFWVCSTNGHFVHVQIVVSHLVAHWIDWPLVWLVATSLGIG